MYILASPASAELTVKGSRFLAEIFPVSAQEDVRPLLKAQKAKYKDATHVVHAFICGKQGQIMGMSDDGEPGGTAGRPILDVLKGRELTNCMLTVTRWFGGTLLGTGGLVHAYSEAAKCALANAAVELLVERTSFSFSADYSLYQMLKKRMEGFVLFGVQEQFAEVVTVTGAIESARYADFAATIFDASVGKVQLS